MCGICGSLSLGGAAVDRALIEKMMDRIRHRGPDGSGVHCEPGAGLGHVRLSIIDIAGGAQPMSAADGSIWITFNGEIFNYIELREELLAQGCRFATASDTEVILHLYRRDGERCVERLNGQWAFAIWDRPQKKLFLSRDRIGVRPLYYTQTPDRLFFASEIKALFACPGVDAALDLEALDQFFTFWTSVPPRTAFRQVLELPPGHSLVARDGQIQVSRYWQLELDPEPPSEGSEQQLAERCLELLQDATRIRLRSDVPVGTYLSGGLDSTIVTALAGQTAGERLRSFSIGFDDAQLDETPYQQEAAAFLGTAHTGLSCSGEAIAESFSDVVWHAEQPLLRTAPAPMFLLARKVRERGFKVVLTGEGADEMFGGYDIFKETKIRSFWGARPESSFRSRLLKRLYPYMDQFQRQSPQYLSRFFQVSPGSLASPYFSHLPRWELTAGLKSFFSRDVQAALSGHRTLDSLAQNLPDSFPALSPFSRAEYLEATLLLPGYILSAQGDRMGMAHAVEHRHPFLDHRVMSFAARLPLRAKMRVLREKHLLKEAGKDLVPPSVLARPKQPYRAPDGTSFFHGTSEPPAALSPDQIRRHGIFDPGRVCGLVGKFQSGKPTSVRDNMALVGILSTELLLDRFLGCGGKA